MAQQQQVNQYTNRSRLALATDAYRGALKARLLLSGPSGSGKTFTALLLASVLAGTDRTSKSIVGIDTEKDSMRTYADLFRLEDGSPGFQHVSWAAPYNATDLALTLRDASNDPERRVVLVDSHSHFWTGQGGILDVANGRWTGWGEARPMHADMIEAILSCDCHVILCAREKQEHVQERNDATGKIEVRKLGMKVQQDSELEFEMNVAISMDMSHVMHVSKSRTAAVEVGRSFIAGHAEEFAGIYREWLESGEPVCTKPELDKLVDVLNRIDDAALRQRAKREFVDTFGRPEMLLHSRYDEATTWVADKLLGIDETPNRAPDAEPPAPKGNEPKGVESKSDVDPGDAARAVAEGEHEPEPPEQPPADDPPATPPAQPDPPAQPVNGAAVARDANAGESTSDVTDEQQTGAAASPDAAEAQSDAQQQDGGDELTDEQRLEQLTAEVTKAVEDEISQYSISDISNALRDAGLNRNGTNTQARARLTKHVIKTRLDERLEQANA